MRRILAAILLCISLATAAHASYIPYGVMNDVSYATVTGSWGWTVNFATSYGSEHINIDMLFHDISPDSYVMIASLDTRTNNFDVLSAALLSDVTSYTSRNQLHFANGANWYYNGGSMGFVGEGDTLNQTEADVNGLTERDRLSWHTATNGAYGAYATLPTELLWGWRSGSNLGLYDSVFMRYVLVGQAPDPLATPEPSTFTLMALGLAGAVCLRRKFGNPPRLAAE